MIYEDVLFIINWINDFINSPTLHLYVSVLQCKIDWWTWLYNNNNNNNNSNFFCANILENQAQWRDKTRG